MESHIIDNRTEEPGSNFVFLVEKADAENEESENQDISIVLSHEKTEEEGQTNSSEVIQIPIVSNQTPYNEFSVTFSSTSEKCCVGQILYQI